jgi:hypothetical protein
MASAPRSTGRFRQPKKKTRELDAKINSKDAKVALSAAYEKLQHQHATYQMINNMAQMRYETSMSIISKMGSGWRYEYRYR